MKARWIGLTWLVALAYCLVVWHYVIKRTVVLVVGE